MKIGNNRKILKKQNTMKTIQSYLPVFTGFYNTLFECNDQQSFIDEYNEENNTDYNYNDFDFDYAEYRDRVSKKCVSVICNELRYDFESINIDFEALVSPRYYNFENDSINVKYTIAHSDFRLLTQYLHDNIDVFTAYLERYKSRSGFISSYSCNPDIWITEYLHNDDILDHCFGAILDFYLENEGFDTLSLYDNLDGENYIEGALNADLVDPNQKDKI